MESRGIFLGTIDFEIRVLAWRKAITPQLLDEEELR